VQIPCFRVSSLPLSEIWEHALAKLEHIAPEASIKGILPEGLVTVINVKWIGSVAIELTYKDAGGNLGSELVYRDREPTIEIVTTGQPWSFDGDGAGVRYVRKPFEKEPDFQATSVNYDLGKLLAQGKEPA
jgi:hypothetical protein